MKRIFLYSLLIILSLQAVPTFGMSRVFQRAAQSISRYFNRVSSVSTAAPHMRPAINAANMQKTASLFNQRAFMSTNAQQKPYQQSNDQEQNNDQQEKSRSWQDYYYDAKERAKLYLKNILLSRTIQSIAGALGVINSAVIECEIKKRDRLKTLIYNINSYSESGDIFYLREISANDIIFLINHKQSIPWKVWRKVVKLLSSYQQETLLLQLKENIDSNLIEKNYRRYLIDLLYTILKRGDSNFIYQIIKQLDSETKGLILNLKEIYPFNTYQFNTKKYQSLRIFLLESSSTFNLYKNKVEVIDEIASNYSICRQIVKEIGMGVYLYEERNDVRESYYFLENFFSEVMVCFVKKEKLSQTGSHAAVTALSYDSHALIYHLNQDCNYDGCKNDSCGYKAMILDAYRYEKQIELENKELAQENQKFIFYHGMRGEKGYWWQMLYSYFNEAKHKRLFKNYYFLRFPKDKECIQIGIDQLKASAQRKEILAYNSTNNESSLLYLNYAIMANMSNIASNSAVHAGNKHFDGSRCNFTTEDIVNKFGENFSKAYLKYAQEFTMLYNEFKKATYHGSLVQIIIPAPVVKKHIFIPDHCARNIRNRETLHPIELIRAIKENAAQVDDYDRIEFCMVVTPDTMYRLQEKGTEIRVYHSADKAVLEDIKHRLRALTQKVADEALQDEKELYNPRECYKKAKELLKQV